MPSNFQAGAALALALAALPSAAPAAEAADPGGLYRLEVPAGWTPSADAEPGTLLFQKRLGMTAAFLILGSDEEKWDRSIAAYVDAKLPELEATTGKLRDVAKTPAKVAGEDGMKVACRAVQGTGEEAAEMRIGVVAALRGGRPALIVLMADPAHFERLSGDLQKCVDSLKWADKAVPAGPPEAPGAPPAAAGEGSEVKDERTGITVFRPKGWAAKVEAPFVVVLTEPGPGGARLLLRGTELPQPARGAGEALRPIVAMGVFPPGTRPAARANETETYAEAEADFERDGRKRHGWYSATLLDRNKVALLAGVEDDAARFQERRPFYAKVFGGVRAPGGGAGEGAGPPVDPAQYKFTRQEGPDRSASLELPPGWRIVDGRESAIVAEGKEGVIAVAQSTSLMTEEVGRATRAMLEAYGQPMPPGYYYCDPQSPRGFLRRTLPDLAALAGWRMTDVEIANEKKIPVSNGERSAMEARLTRQVGAETRRLHGVAFVTTWRVSPESWAFYYSGIFGNQGEAERTMPLLHRIYSSYEVSAAYRQKQLDDIKKNLQEINDLIKTADAVQRTAHTRARVMWELYRAGGTATVDTQTGESGQTGYGMMDGLNQRAAYGRYKEINLMDNEGLLNLPKQP